MELMGEKQTFTLNDINTEYGISGQRWRGWYRARVWTGDKNFVFLLNSVGFIDTNAITDNL